MPRVLKQPGTKPIGGPDPPVLSPQVEGVLRRIHRPYRPARQAWIIGLIIVLLAAGALLMFFALQPPALDPSQPPPFPPLDPNAERVYLIGDPQKQTTENPPP